MSNDYYINDVNTFAENISSDIYERARRSCNSSETHCAGDGNANLAGWDRLLQDKDDKWVWQAINWKGCLHDDDTDTHVKPSDKEFKRFYDNLMNMPTDDFAEICQEINVAIPVLDDPISPVEVTTQINKMKADKACGPDGIAPGVFRLLPAQWLLHITALFNLIFTRHSILHSGQELNFSVSLK